MKFSTLFLAATGLLGLITLPTPEACAQRGFRPFGPGRTYHYRQSASMPRAADSLFTFRVDSLAVQGADTVFFFNRTLPSGGLLAREQRVNIHGGWLRWTDSTGTATIGSGDTSATLEIRTRAPRMTPWPFIGTLTAAVTGRSVARFLGILDTLLTVRISDGRTLLLGRRLGLIDGGNLDYYLSRPGTARHQRRDLVLDAIPEVHGSGADLRWEAIYDLQPGDTLYYYQRESYEPVFPQPGSGPSSVRVWEMLTFQQRQQSANGDTLRFAGLRTFRRARYATSDFTGPDSVTYVANEAYAQERVRPPGRFMTGTTDNLPGGNASARLQAYQLTDSLAGRPQASMMLLNPDFSQSATFATGLGMVKRNDSFGGAVNTSFTRRLIGFVKNNGAIRWGITTAPQPLPLAVSADLPRRLPATLAPNPVSADTSPTVQFTLNRAQAVALTVCDAVGRVVAAAAPAALAAGPQRLPVPGTAALTPGVYHVRLTLADGRQTHLRLVRE